MCTSGQTRCGHEDESERESSQKVKNTRALRPLVRVLRVVHVVLG